MWNAAGAMCVSGRRPHFPARERGRGQWSKGHGCGIQSLRGKARRQYSREFSLSVTLLHQAIHDFFVDLCIGERVIHIVIQEPGKGGGIKSVAGEGGIARIWKRGVIEPLPRISQMQFYQDVDRRIVLVWRTVHPGAPGKEGSHGKAGKENALSFCPLQASELFSVSSLVRNV